MVNIINPQCPVESRVKGSRCYDRLRNEHCTLYGRKMSTV